MEGIAAEVHEAACLIQPHTLCAAGIFRSCWHVAQLAAELSGPISRRGVGLDLG